MPSNNMDWAPQSNAIRAADCPRSQIHVQDHGAASVLAFQTACGRYERAPFRTLWHPAAYCVRSFLYVVADLISRETLLAAQQFCFSVLHCQRPGTIRGFRICGPHFAMTFAAHPPVSTPASFSPAKTFIPDLRHDRASTPASSVQAPISLVVVNARYTCIKISCPRIHTS